MRTVFVVPHTHWDREWYQPHELFRWRLVQMIDELLDVLEGDPEFPCFNLDGQTIVIDDYLEVRPENEGRLRRLIEAGRVLIGPWWVQPDEFLPTAESHVRSLVRGIRRADELGGSMRIGHCADQFGHIAQMPQIMAQLGLSSACIWRGVGDTVPGWSFQWEAPDGTRIPVLYLRNSYSSGWRLPSEPADLVERTKRQEVGRRDGEPALLMNGTDHSRVEKDVPRILAAAAGQGYDYRMATLVDYERAMFAAGIDEHVERGELRSPDRSNVLVGVLSARMPIKQRDFEVSGLFERVAEPMEALAALHGGIDGRPAMRHAWKVLLENSPHDSICGCSVDQTHREMMPRFDRAEQLGREVVRSSFSHLAGRINTGPDGALLVFRGVPNARIAIEAEVPASWRAGGLRLPSGEVVRASIGDALPATVLNHFEATPAAVARQVDFIREGRLDTGFVQEIAWELRGRHLVVEVAAGEGANVVDVERARDEIWEVAKSGVADTAEFTAKEWSTRTLRAVLPASATIGLEALTPVQDAPSPAVTAGKRWIRNEHYEVRWKKGELVIRDLERLIEFRGMNTYVDEGDRGDEYNADILPDAILEPVLADLVGVECDGVQARLEYLTLLELPAALGRKRRRRLQRESVIVPILTRVTLWAGVPRVEFEAEVDNSAEDHRLRALFPIPFEVETALTENQFHVAERSLEPARWNGTSPELPPTTFPQKTFTAFETEGFGMAVFNRGLPEGEVVTTVEGDQAYALTLMRCVGWLSRPDLVSRRFGAGPTVQTFDSQLQGVHTFNYAWTTYEGGWRHAGVQPLAHSFAYPVMATATNEHEGSQGNSLPLVRIEPDTAVPSAVVRSELDGSLLVRVYNAAPEDAEVHVWAEGASGPATLVDLMELPAGEVREVDGGRAFDLRSWGIATLRIG